MSFKNQKNCFFGKDIHLLLTSVVHTKNVLNATDLMQLKVTHEQQKRDLNNY